MRLFVSLAIAFPALACSSGQTSQSAHTQCSLTIEDCNKFCGDKDPAFWCGGYQCGVYQCSACCGSSTSNWCCWGPGLIAQPARCAVTDAQCLAQTSGASPCSNFGGHSAGGRCGQPQPSSACGGGPPPVAGFTCCTGICGATTASWFPRADCCSDSCVGPGIAPHCVDTTRFVKEACQFDSDCTNQAVTTPCTNGLCCFPRGTACTPNPTGDSSGRPGSATTSTCCDPLDSCSGGVCKCTDPACTFIGSRTYDARPCASSPICQNYQEVATYVVSEAGGGFTLALTSGCLLPVTLRSDNQGLTGFTPTPCTLHADNGLDVDVVLTTYSLLVGLGTDTGHFLVDVRGHLARDANQGYQLFAKSR
jgi:hypothetical protein